VPPTFDRRGFVVKEFFGREGEEVYFGERIDEVDWERCRGWRTFVVQRQVVAERVVDLTWSAEHAERVWRVPCIGSYLADNRWAGLYVRVGEQVTTNRAQHVAAFVERLRPPAAPGAPCATADVVTRVTDRSVDGGADDDRERE
jgi:hypothetical protein